MRLDEGVRATEARFAATTNQWLVVAEGYLGMFGCAWGMLHVIPHGGDYVEGLLSSGICRHMYRTCYGNAR